MNLDTWGPGDSDEAHAPAQPLARELIGHLLAVAKSYDRRQVGEAEILAWTEASARGRWDYSGALGAIHHHYAESTDFIRPGHITQRLRADVRQPQRYVQLDELGPPATRERIREVLTELANRLDWAQTPAALEPALAVACPWCGASEHRPCRLRNGREVRGEARAVRPHPARRALVSR